MKDKKLNIILGIVIALFLIMLALLFVKNRKKPEVIETPPTEDEKPSWDPESPELYVTEDLNEFGEVYDEMGMSSELMQINETAIMDRIATGIWYFTDEEVTYKLSFRDNGTVVIEGDDTTSSGEYVCEYHSDAPQFMYMKINSTYVNIEGFIGYNYDYLYLYSNAEDEMQTPPVYDYYLLRRNIDG